MHFQEYPDTVELLELCDQLKTAQNNLDVISITMPAPLAAKLARLLNDTAHDPEY